MTVQTKIQKTQGLIHSQCKEAVFPLISMGDLLVHPSSNFGSASFQFLGLSCTSLKTSQSYIQSKHLQGVGERRIFVYVSAFRQNI